MNDLYDVRDTVRINRVGIWGLANYESPMKYKKRLREGDAGWPKKSNINI